MLSKLDQIPFTEVFLTETQLETRDSKVITEGYTEGIF